MKQIVILGRGVGWNSAPDGECWAVCSAVGNRFVQGKDLNRSFDIHVLSQHPQSKEKSVKHIAWERMVNELNLPHYMPEVDPAIPSSRKYPLEQIVNKFKTDYFTNSIAYMIALALYEGVEKIDIYGVNMSLGSEYASEKAGVEFWIGIGIGAGVDITVHGKETELLIANGLYGKGNLYGYGLKQGRA